MNLKLPEQAAAADCLQLNSPLLPGVPSVFDIDIGKDPDDTVVAAMAAQNTGHFHPVLFITNDESPSRGRARFLSALVEAFGNTVPVAAGLPSTRPAEVIVETAGITPSKDGGTDTFEPDGVAALERLFERHQRLNYFGLGALTNLRALIDRRPDIAGRVNLIQMGGALNGAYERSNAQYNVRLDVESFRRVLEEVPEPTLVMSHASWGSYDPQSKESRQQLGVYVDDPVTAELRASSLPGLKLVAAHLQAWKDLKGRDCSIMHDPLTVLSSYEPGLVEFSKGEITIDQQGVVELTANSRRELAALGPETLQKLTAYMETRAAQNEDLPSPGILVKKITFSLSTHYERARKAIVRWLLGEQTSELADEWERFNRPRAG
jgi:inosine-uridine nucleoside N-ribohydrolase